MKKKKEVLCLAVLVFLLFALNYGHLDKITGNFLDTGRTAHITRIIDGDTIVAGNETIRMLGINAPEHDEFLFDKARNFTNQTLFNKTVYLEFGRDEKDRYGRTLAYVFLNNKDINLELVRNGLANFYFPQGKDKHFDEFHEAWGECINDNINLCEMSSDKCSGCIELKEFSVKGQKVVFHNSCNFSCDLTNWGIKDEGRKNFVFPHFVLESEKDVEIAVGEGRNTSDKFFWTGYTYVWTKTGDTLFLRDRERKLVLWSNY